MNEEKFNKMVAQRNRQEEMKEIENLNRDKFNHYRNQIRNTIHRNRHRNQSMN